MPLRQAAFTLGVQDAQRMKSPDLSEAEILGLAATPFSLSDLTRKLQDHSQAQEVEIDSTNLTFAFSF
jgi:hypothetical protein